MSGCRHARSAGLAALAGRLPEAERLVLESHLAACAACAEEQARLRLFDVLRSQEPPPLSPRSRTRAIEGALEALESRVPARAVMTGRRWGWALAAGLALLAVGGAIGLSASGSDRPARRIVEADPEPSARDPGGPRVLAFGSAWVVPSQNAEVTWIASTETLSLRTGEVRVSVPEGGRSIRVATDRFVVVALASTFVASLTSVRVEIGWVRIEDPSGEEIARLTEGGEWHAVTVASVRTSVCERCPALLREAAATLGHGRTAEARSILERVLAAGPTGGQAVEAGLLLADAARIEGNPAEAIRRYRQIARRHRGTAGENALYAAAQLEAERGRGEAARGLLREYLERYPSGRFARDAQRRLGRTER